MYDRFEPLKTLKMIDFNFHSSRFENWIGGKMISSGESNSTIIGKVIFEGLNEVVEVSFNNSNIFSELSPQNIFDIFISNHDRLQLLTIPNFTNVENMGIMSSKLIIGATRERKNFNRNEAYCCNLFLADGKLEKITFSFSNPERLLEFYK